MTVGHARKREKREDRRALKTLGRRVDPQRDPERLAWDLTPGSAPRTEPPPPPLLYCYGAYVLPHITSMSRHYLERPGDYYLGVATIFQSLSVAARIEVYRVGRLCRERARPNTSRFRSPDVRPTHLFVLKTRSDILTTCSTVGRRVGSRLWHPRRSFRVCAVNPTSPAFCGHSGWCCRVCGHCINRSFK